MTQTFFDVKNFFLKRNKQTGSLICLKIAKWIIFSDTGVICILHRVQKGIKFMAINFRGRTNVKCFMQTQLLRFCQDTGKVSALPLLKVCTKWTYFFPARRRYHYCGLTLKQIKYKRPQNLTSKKQAVKNLQIAKTFSKNVNK